MKAETRVIGIDDGDTRRRRRVVVGAIFRGGLWLDGIVSSYVDVSTPTLGKVLGDMVVASKFYKELRFAILHGTMLRSGQSSVLAEFNNTTEMPTIAILRQRYSEMFDCAAGREKSTIRFRLHDLSVLGMGLTKEEAMEILRITCLRGHIPEPVRVAGLIASTVNAPKRLNWTRGQLRAGS